MAPYGKLDFTGIPWKQFQAFIDMAADRFAILNGLLNEAGLEYRTVTIAGHRHFFVAPPPPEEDFLRRKPTVLSAHYDRAPGSPGANDNSAAVFLLIETAVKLRREKVNNWLIIFTDKEELGPGESVENQGSYTLASAFKDTGMDNARIFNFDTCGRGDTLIISTTADYLLKGEPGAGSERMRSSVHELREAALVTARNLNMVRALLLPTPFSDDAGFFRAGMAAQTITMLPAEECSALISTLRRDPGFAGALVSRDLRAAQNRRLIPETWRSINSPGDSHLRLTPDNFRLVTRFAEALCGE
jgi:hypothetical protein